MSGDKRLPLKLAAPARIETADGWSINLPWARHGDDDPYAEAEAFAPLLVDMVNSYASSQAEIERLKDLCRRAREMTDVMEKMTGCRGDDDWVWALQADLDAALSGSKE